MNCLLYTSMPADGYDATDEQMEAAKSVVEQRLVNLQITDSEVYADSGNDRIVAVPYTHLDVYKRQGRGHPCHGRVGLSHLCHLFTSGGCDELYEHEADGPLSLIHISITSAFSRLKKRM